MASFTPAAMDLISRGGADYRGSSVPAIYPCSTQQRQSYAKRLMKFPVRSWSANIFLSLRIIAMFMQTTPSELRELWTQWRQNIMSFVELTAKRYTNCCL